MSKTNWNDVAFGFMIGSLITFLLLSISKQENWQCIEWKNKSIVLEQWDIWRSPDVGTKYEDIMKYFNSIKGKENLSLIFYEWIDTECTPSGCINGCYCVVTLSPKEGVKYAYKIVNFGEIPITIYEGNKQVCTKEGLNCMNDCRYSKCDPIVLNEICCPMICEQTRDVK